MSDTHAPGPPERWIKTTAVAEIVPGFTIELQSLSSSGKRYHQPPARISVTIRFGNQAIVIPATSLTVNSEAVP